MVAGMIAPLLEARERENRRLKRMLSERWGVEGDE